MCDGWYREKWYRKNDWNMDITLQMIEYGDNDDDDDDDKDTIPYPVVVVVA